ncbi:sugar-transfer associated ATP-grasp domain-containing protein [Thioclava pacifica]|uniref:Alpha-L-glutamate ligase-related protein ATP-grasp domain-containing protein n=1 Tax=Thioclava pacifica DSM 10166 TaxID=1353537 RepID=A0A074J7J0_9RHOB|nr:sugar-transfer associated ATP-grasp domain-containing protein [Thioclava pacifica]KEO51845.1 hypothetical protein TP2_10225 [Thioclava pacifica DSM 10166]
MSLATLDETNYTAARDSSTQDLLVYAAKKSGRSVLQVLRDYRQMAKSETRINLVEYVRFGLYDQARFQAQERAAFLSNDLHWPIANKVNNRGWYSAAEDKSVATTLLSAAGVPVPEIVAVLDSSQRIYPGDGERITSADELRAFLLARPGQQFFGKINDGMVSFGAFRIERADAEMISCSGHDPMSYEDFAAQTLAQNAYILQPVIENHSALKPFASALATIRMVNLITDDGLRVPMAAIKLPQGDNIADAFWRPGNLACAIDVETGRIRTVARRGIEVEFLEDHPDQAGLMGMILPFWSEVLEINERAARSFAPIRYQSTDIAITETGPVVVEINAGGGFDLPQYSNGKGMLTPEVRAFFESCGVEFKPKKSLLPF